MAGIENTLYAALPVLAVTGALWHFGAFRKQEPPTDAWMKDYLVTRNGHLHVIHPDPNGIIVTIRSFPLNEKAAAEAFIKKQGPAGLRMLSVAAPRRAKGHTELRKS